METLTLTVPEANAAYEIVSLSLHWNQSLIRCTVKDGGGKNVTHLYEGPAALTLMRQLNTANLSTASLHKRLLDRLVADGRLPGGTVTGSPD